MLVVRGGACFGRAEMHASLGPHRGFSGWFVLLQVFEGTALFVGVLFVVRPSVNGRDLKGTGDGPANGALANVVHGKGAANYFIRSGSIAVVVRRVVTCRGQRFVGRFIR